MKRKGEINRILSGIILPVLVVVALVCFFAAVSNLIQGHEDENLLQLEETLRRAAVACYAAEGIYPPDLAYLQERYGVQIDSKRFVVNFVSIADNLMPDITILEK